MRCTMLLLMPFMVGACQKGPSVETPEQADARIAEESRVARPEIEATGAALSRLLGEAVDSAAQLVTADYKWHMPNSPAGAGRENFVNMVKDFTTTVSLTQSSTTESVLANGPIAIETGHYVLTMTPKPGAPKGTVASADTGKYVWQWRKVDGSWKLALASWNTDLPAK